MHYKKALLFLLMTIITLCSAQEKTYPSEAYFDPSDIKRQIISAIEKSKESVDIAVSDITSRDIIHSLLEAHGRGVHIRIVVDRRRSLSRRPLSLLCQKQNETFMTKLFDQKGIMRNNFAIFDSALLVTGSYQWSENEGKHTRYNVIFTDIAKVLVKYQKEFEYLFSKAVAPPITSTASPKRGNTESTFSQAHSESKKNARQIIAKNYGIIITATEEGSIDMDFEEFDTIFGVASELLDEQKEALWHPCKGKRITWSGRVNYIGWGLFTGWMMGVDHGDTSVEVKLNPANKKYFSNVKHGNTVTYTGRVASRVTRIFPYKLEDGYVLEILDTEVPPPPPLCPESIRNHDIIPVSQGPKKNIYYQIL